MTEAERIQYCASNQPTKIKTDDLGRYVKCIWRLVSGKIIEVYHYDHSDAEITKANKASVKKNATVAEKKTVFKMRQCFAVKKIQTNIQPEEEVDDINE